MNTHSASTGSVVYIGVDVCAKWLDIHGLKSQKVKRLANSEAGHAKLITELPARCHVVMEASGGYEHALWLALLRAGKTTSRVNPGRVRHFAKATMRLAKTDAIDAAVLSSFGEALKPRADVLPADWELELADLVGRREQLVAVRAQQKTQLHQITHKALLTQARALIKALNGQIQHLNELIAAVMGNKEAQARAERLQQMNGIAQVAAATLMAELPELGSLDDARISSLCGPCEIDGNSAAHIVAHRELDERVRVSRAGAHPGLEFRQGQIIHHPCLGRRRRRVENEEKRQEHEQQHDSGRRHRHGMAAMVRGRGLA